MKLPGRKTAKPTGRQRVVSDESGQPVNRTFSYRASRSDTEVNTGRKVQRQAIRIGANAARNFWIQRFGLIVLLIAGVVSVANVLTLSSQVTIQPLTSGQQNSSLLQSNAVYEAAAAKVLKESFLNGNKLTVDANKVSTNMLRTFPELTDVSVTIPLVAHRPVVYVQPAQPAVILAGANGVFLLDTSGKALRIGADIASLKQPTLPVITDHSGLHVQLNHQALPASTISFVTEVIGQLRSKNITVAALTLPPAANELDVQIAGEAYTVKFNLQSNTARQQAGTYLATIARLQKQATKPAHYIDVRVDGRAYYN